MGKRAAVADKAQADKANEKSKEVTCDVPDWLKKLQAFAESCSLQSESTEVAAADKIALKVANLLGFEHCTMFNIFKLS